MMEKSTEEEEESEGDRGIKRKSFDTLRTLTRVGSNESVQHWIDSLTDDDWKSSTDEKTYLTNANGASRVRCNFLLVPGAADDELFLGADARSLSCEESEHTSTSQRVSPSFLDDIEPPFPFSNISESYPARLETEGQAKSVLEAQSGHEEKFSTDDREIFPQTCFADRGDNIVQHQDSIEGFQSVSSFLAAMETDPEDVLISLGFGEEISSPVRRIPPRFFANPSQAKGIDVCELYSRFMDLDSAALRGSIDYERRNSLTNRFSQSSIDLSMVECNASVFAKMRRAKYKDSIIPSITVCDENEDDEVASEKNSHARLSGHLRLSTVEEEREPNSRTSSLSRSFSGDKRKVLQKQERMDTEEGGELKDSVFDSMDHPENAENSRNENNHKPVTLHIQEKRELTNPIISMLSEHQCTTDQNAQFVDVNNNFSVANYLVENTTDCFPVKNRDVAVEQFASESDIIGEPRGSSAEETPEESAAVNADADGSLTEGTNDENLTERGDVKAEVLSKAMDETAESECSFPDSIEVEYHKGGCLLDVPRSFKQEIVQQFSDDSLDVDCHELERRRNQSRGDGGEGEVLKDEDRWDVSPSRIVYRTLGKIENLKDTICENADEVLDNDGSLEQSKPGNVLRGLWGRSGERTLSLERHIPPSPPGDLTQSCSTENVTKMRPSSRLRDYFRKLANGTNRRFFSLEALNTIGAKERSRSHEDLVYPNQSACPKLSSDRVVLPNGFASGEQNCNKQDIKEKPRTENRPSKELELGATNVLNIFETAKSTEHEKHKIRDVSAVSGMEVSGDAEIVPERKKYQSTADVFFEGGPNGKRKRKRILKGYSVESSGFEEEYDGCKNLPERGPKTPPERVCIDSKRRHQLCEDCLQKFEKQTILEASIPMFDKEDIGGKGQNSQLNSCENQGPNLTQDQFDYLVVQMTSLKQELGEQEERLKRFIDDSAEKIKTSLLTELSILNASFRTGSVNIEY